MLKKIGKFIRFCFIFAVWTCLFSAILICFFKYVWNFNITKARDWRIIANFWNEGGTIKNWKDILFFISLGLILPLWFIGLRKALKISVVKVIFFPIFWYNAYQERKYSKTPKNIVLKNMGVTLGEKSSKQSLEEMIASRMPKETEKKDLNSAKIRSSVEEKNTEFHQKKSE